ncbi:MAG: hypothetical protein NVSMB51_02260 [Solirubrobacteraceae bacterium]
MVTAPQLERRLAAAESDGSGPIIVDLAAVSFIDSSGLRSLLGAHARSERDGNRLRLTQASEPVQRVLSLAGVLETLPLE